MDAPSSIRGRCSTIMERVAVSAEKEVRTRERTMSPRKADSPAGRRYADHGKMRCLETQSLIQRVARQGMPRARAWMYLARRQCLSAIRQVKPRFCAPRVGWKSRSESDFLGLVMRWRVGTWKRESKPPSRTLPPLERMREFGAL